MTQLFRYIFKQMFRTTSLVALICLAVVWLSKSLGFIDMIVNQGLDAASFLFMSSMMIPSFLSLILPVSVFVGVLLVYVRLLNDRELIVMCTSGLGQLRILNPAMAVAAVVCIILYAINFYFMPLGYRAFKDKQFELRNNITSRALREGVFNVFNDDLTVYVRSRENDGSLQGILIHTSKDHRIAQTFMAESAQLLQTTSGPRVALENGTRQEIDRKTGLLKLLYFERHIFDLNQFIDAPSVARWRKANERFVGELFFPDLTDPDTRANAKKFRAEGHHRLVWPLYSFVFVLLASGTVLTNNIDQRAIWRRIVPASGLCILTLITGLTLRSAVSFNSNLWPIFYAVPSILVVGSIWIMNRQPNRREMSAT